MNSIELKSAKPEYIQLFVSCRNLRSLGFLSKADPMAVLFLHRPEEEESNDETVNNLSNCFGFIDRKKVEDEPLVKDEEQKEEGKVVEADPEKDGMFFEIGRTNMVKDESDPNFFVPIVLNLNMYRGRPLRFIVVDVDEEDSISNDDIIGFADFKLDELLETQNLTLKRTLKVGHNQFGTLYIVGERLGWDLESKVRLQFASHQLPSMRISPTSCMFKLFSWICTPQYFLVLSRQIANMSTFHPIYCTEAQLGFSQPYWDDIVLPVALFHNGDKEANIRIELFHYRSTNSKILVATQIIQAKELVQEKVRQVHMNFCKHKHLTNCCFVEPQQCNLLVIGQYFKKKTIAFEDIVADALAKNKQDKAQTSQTIGSNVVLDIVISEADSAKPTLLPEGDPEEKLLIVQ